RGAISREELSRRARPWLVCRPRRRPTRVVILGTLATLRGKTPLDLGERRAQLPPRVSQPKQLVEPPIREHLRARRAQPLHLRVRRRIPLPEIFEQLRLREPRLLPAPLRRPRRHQATLLLRH